MKRFGPQNTDPSLPWVPVPVGTRCAWCEEPFESIDDGFLIPFLGKPGDPPELAYHRACQVRQIIGSLAHVRRECGCYVPGSQRSDPPEMTRRQAADAAVNEFTMRSRCPSSLRRLGESVSDDRLAVVIDNGGANISPHEVAAIASELLARRAGSRQRTEADRLAVEHGFCA